MNAFLHDHGYGVSLLIGIALLVIGILWQPILLLPGIVFALIGVVARPIEEFAVTRTSVKLTWQRAVAQALQRGLEERLTVSDSFEAKVIRGSGNVVVTPGPARVRLRTFEPTVIVRPQSPDKFAETLIEQIIEPAMIASEAKVHAPSVEQGQPKDPA